MIDHAYLNAYIDRLRAHDWSYEFSDDPRVFKAGQASKHALEREAALDTTGVLRKLYDARATTRETGNGSIEAQITFAEFVDLVLRRNAAGATRPSDTQRLARTVRVLAHALARADPDNQLPGRAIELLQQLGLLEATLLPPPSEASNPASR